MSYQLKLADGTIIGADGRVQGSGSAPSDGGSTAVGEDLVEVPTNREAQQLVVAVRKKLSDLPDVPRTMNTVSVVLSYTLFGLDDDEIALATGLTSAQVANVKATDAFVAMNTDVVRNIIAAESTDVRDLFVQHARSAASTIVNVMQSGKTEHRLKAAADILDRGGFRPTDVHEHRHLVDGGLTIEYVRRDESSIPTIDVVVEQ